MNIIIEYDSCWQNSVLDNNTISPQSNTRKFNKSGSNFQPITKNTVMGVLYRLIGDQRTLCQITKSDNHYFSDIEDKIKFSLNNSFNYKELAMIINKSNDRTSDGNYIGVVRDDVKLFFSKNAPKLWSSLYLSVDEIIDFINNPILIGSSGSAMPRDILNRIDEIQDMDPLETMDKIIGKQIFAYDKQKARLETVEKDKNLDDKKQKTTTKIKETMQKIDDKIKEIKQDETIIKRSNMIKNTLLSLKKHFPEIDRDNYIKKGGEILPIRLYAAALYLQANLLEKSGNDMNGIYTLQTKGVNNGIKTIQGFSRKGFNGIRDFLNPLSTGGDKKTVKTPFSLTKASGQLEINIKTRQANAEKIKLMIENASVSSFYLGKKGLAYVSDIRI